MNFGRIEISPGGLGWQAKANSDGAVQLPASPIDTDGLRENICLILDYYWVAFRVEF